MGKALKSVALIFSFGFLLLLIIAYFYEYHAGFKNYINQSLISSIPYLFDLVVHINHYKLKVEWILYFLLVSLTISYRMGLLGDSKAKTINISMFIFAFFTLGLAIIYIWPSNTINLLVFEFERGSRTVFFNKGKYIFDIMTMCYLSFFILMATTNMNKEKT